MQAMDKLSRQDLHTLESYAQIRPQFRSEVLAHKKNRVVRLGDHATLYFEDRVTIQYQIQEMLRVERIFEPQGIQEELDAYNPLIPDGGNLKATFMLEYDNVEERRQALAKMSGIEDKVWVQVQGFDPVFAIADEDLERETEEKTSSVHFVRFEFTPEMIVAAKNGVALNMGIDHPAYTSKLTPVPDNIKQSLLEDFD